MSWPAVWIFNILFSISFLCADVMDHLKRIDPREHRINHSVKNIDFIYMINLDERPEKFIQSVQRLSIYGIHPFRFSAVNGWNLNLKAINELGIKYHPPMRRGFWGTCYLLEKEGEPHHEMMSEIGRTYFSHCMTRGAIGIVLSHLSVLQDAYDSGYETIWVMEDDIEMIRNPHLLSEYIEKLDHLVGKEGWDILFTDRDTKDKNGEYVPCLASTQRPNFSPQNPYQYLERVDLSADFRRIGARYGAYSMIVRRSGMEKILNFFNHYQIFLPFDMEYTLVPDIRLFTPLEDIVSTDPRALSDNGLPTYQNLAWKHFNPSEKDQIKQTAFSMMDQLHGWCSHEKASTLIDLILHAHSQTIVEIGVFGGKSLIPMAYALKVQGSGHIFGIDPWDSRESAHGLSDAINRNWWGDLDHGPILKDLRDKIDVFNLKEQIQLIQNTSAGADPIEEIDLLHIDGNHAEEHSFYDVMKWGPLVKKGGWIIFDDVGWKDNGTDASARAIAWLNNHCIKYAEFTDTSTWGIWIKP